MGPQLPFSEELHATKYRSKGESFRDAMTRVANALADDRQHFHRFRDILSDMSFLPGGRVQAAMGSPKAVTAYNCFVSGTIEDSFVDGNGSIMARAAEAATTMRMGGGIGYGFGRLRPRGALIRKLHSASSGPVSFMGIYNSICQCVSSSGHRRGAQMAVLPISHPDIEEFIRCKQPPKEADPIIERLADLEPNSPEWLRWFTTLQAVYQLTGFNISVGVTDQFMHCLADDRPFPLVFEGKVYDEVDPGELWNTIMRSTWDYAEPGVLFMDTINNMNNLRYCEQIESTNPCAEQPLPPNGACLLGSFNLVKYVSNGEFDFERFDHDIAAVVRAMDNVIDRTTYPLFEQELEAKNKRRMGLGVTGAANAIEYMGHPYGSASFNEALGEILRALAVGCYRTSIDLAQEKGTFPLYDSIEYPKSRFIQAAFDGEDDLMFALSKHGIRNSHLTSIAPTGTISMTADNVSSGIEPVFSYHQKRIITLPDGTKRETDFEDYGSRVFGIKGRRAQDLNAQDHLRVLATSQRWVDSAVSKTCNVPSDMPWADFKRLYVQAWEMGCKGITTFQDGGKRMGILKSADEDTKACRIDPDTGRKECE